MRGKTLIEAAFGEDAEWSPEELADFMAEHADWFESCPLAEDSSHDPFKNGDLLHNVGAGSGGKNGRSKTGECKCSSDGKYVQTCTCTSKKTGKTSTRTIDMSKYYGSGAKAAYMKKWRQMHGPHTKK